MKKTLAMAIMITMLISVLAACGSNNKGEEGNKGTEPEAEKVKLSLWHNFTGDDLRAQEMRKIIEKYQADHPNVTLDIQAIPPDGYKTRLKTVAAANQMPDVFILSNGSMTQEFSAGGLIQPVNELLDSKPEWKNNFLPNSFDAFTVDGNIYSAPMGLSPTSILYYNKTILEDNGLTVPTTWDEMLNAIKVLNEKKITPIALGNKAAWLAQSSIFSSLADRVTGTEWFLKAAKQDGASFTDPEFVQALTYMQELGNAKAFQDGFNAIDNTQMEQMFAQGKAAMMIDGGWALSNLASNASEDAMKQMGATVLPSIPGGKGDPKTLSGVVGVGMGLGKDATGPKKDAAYELIYAMSGPEAQQVTLNSNNLVSYKAELDETKVTPIFKEVFELVNNVTLTPVYDGKLTSAGADAVNNGLQELLMGGKPEDVAKKIQDAQAKALAK